MVAFILMVNIATNIDVAIPIGGWSLIASIAFFLGGVFVALDTMARDIERREQK
jgi:uncharacterized PurR-regulated membrane protein YhhQ (DUF165 family)